MPHSHGALPRGLDAARSPLFQGRFGRMFRNLPPARFGPTDADALAALMRLGEKMCPVPADRPSNGPDPEESGIPALYTYFGQFIDHDITFDPVSVLTKFRDPDGLTDFRTPALDLDNVYGRGPSDQPYMYDGSLFRLGDPITGAPTDAHDLPRFAGRALIGDPRNDENAVVSQLQGLFLRFHNRFVADNPQLAFEEVQQRVRFHYQYVILNDFLPRIVSPQVLEPLRTDGRFDPRRLKFFHWKNRPFMPVEFSVAGYRLGHSMVRPGYRLNDDPASLLPIFPTAQDPVGLTGFQPMGPGRAIDWGRFIDLDQRPFGGDGQDAGNGARLQFAYRLDTSLVGQLAGLPAAVAADPPPSLAQRNLERGWRLGLPSGQSVARAMELQPLADAEILIGKAVDVPAAGETPVPIAEAAGGVFAGNCPLWTYILAEAAHHRRGVKVPVAGDVTVGTPQLGPVGGRIVAEVLIGLMAGDGASMLSLDPRFAPVTGPAFALKDLVAYALGHGDPLH
jgi:Animal haem peroxidase